MRTIIWDSDKHRVDVIALPESKSIEATALFIQQCRGGFCVLILDPDTYLPRPTRTKTLEEWCDTLFAGEYEQFMARAG